MFAIHYKQTLTTLASPPPAIAARHLARDGVRPPPEAPFVTNSVGHNPLSVTTRVIAAGCSMLRASS
jgi:hypothetical protein